MKNRFPFSNKTLIIAIIFFVLLTTVAFLYVQVRIERHKPLTGDYDSAVFDCPNVVQDKQSASECFNLYFEEVLKEQEIVRGVGNIPDHIFEHYEAVDESQIVSGEGENYLINRGRYGVPIYIKDSVVFFMHG